MAIRNLLDKHFDDGVGRYLDGMSDEKIAEQAKVQTVVVKNLREAAYGPEIITGEVQRVLDNLAKLTADVAALQKLVDKMISGRSP